MIKIGYNYDMYILNPYIYGAAGTTYLLDTYSAAAAYSLRQLKTGVTNVVRVRRSGDNAESDFTATDITDGSLASWVTAGGGTEDGYVAQWYDQSGNGRTQIQSTAGSQPKIVSSGSLITENGLPAVNDSASAGIHFDESSNGTAVHWSFAVIKRNGAAHCMLSSGTSSFYHLCATSASASYGGMIGTPIIYQDGGSTGIGLTRTNIQNATTNQTLLTLVGNNSGWGGSDLGRSSGTFPMYKTQEFIIFDSSQSGNKTAIESDINTYYSIY